MKKISLILMFGLSCLQADLFRTTPTPPVEVTTQKDFTFHVPLTITNIPSSVVYNPANSTTKQTITKYDIVCAVQNAQNTTLASAYRSVNYAQTLEESVTVAFDMPAAKRHLLPTVSQYYCRVDFWLSQSGGPKVGEQEYRKLAIPYNVITAKVEGAIE
jgi:hypothetical protein